MNIYAKQINKKVHPNNFNNAYLHNTFTMYLNDCVDVWNPAACDFLRIQIINTVITLLENNLNYNALEMFKNNSHKRFWNF